MRRVFSKYPHPPQTWVLRSWVLWSFRSSIISRLFTRSFLVRSFFYFLFSFCSLVQNLIRRDRSTPYPVGFTRGRRGRTGTGTGTVEEGRSPPSPKSWSRESKTSYLNVGPVWSRLRLHPHLSLSLVPDPPGLHVRPATSKS